MNKILREFNEDVHIDYMWIKNLTQNPILHMRDSHTGYSNAIIVQNRDMELASNIFQINWVNVHGGPTYISADPESIMMNFLNHSGEFAYNLRRDRLSGTIRWEQLNRQTSSGEQ